MHDRARRSRGHRLLQHGDGPVSLPLHQERLADVVARLDETLSLALGVGALRGREDSASANALRPAAREGMP
ncbi:MAG TPA: hypothetical protein VGL02_32355 [Streptomyces sp.]